MSVLPKIAEVEVDIKPTDAQKKLAIADDELVGYKESMFAYIFRFLPRYILRGLQRLGYKDTPLLKGVLDPVDTEISFQEELLVVEGALPQDLSGVLVRTGPNDLFKPWGGYHLFDGSGMVHSVCFEGGEAKSYSNHWIRCKRYLYEKAAGCNLFIRFGELQGVLGIVIMTFSSLFSWCLFPTNPSHPSMGPLGNTALVWHSGKLLALMEGGFPYLLRLCAGMVKSVSSYSFGGGLGHNFTAHPKVDPKSGEMLSFAYRQNAKLTPKGEDEAKVVYFTVSPSGHKGKNHAVDVQAGQIMHDFAISENYAVFMDHALVFDGKTMVKENSLPFKTDTSRNSRIGLVKRAAPEEGVQWFEVPPFVCMHTATAFEEGTKVHLVVSRYESLSLSGDFTPGQNPPGEPFRFTLDVATGAATQTRLAEGLDMDFPVIPPHLVTQPAKYMYMAGNKIASRRFGVMMDVLAKYDMTADADKGLIAQIKLPDGCSGGEFIMVPRAAPLSAAEAEEDDGWLLGHVTDEHTMKSYVLVYDAKTMSSVPAAKVAMPQRVPLGFHGMFVHQEQLKLQSS